MSESPSQRLDLSDEAFRGLLLPYCRLQSGEVWYDPISGHVVACGDCADTVLIDSLGLQDKGSLAIQDPPYNLVAFEERSVEEYIEFSRQWIANTRRVLADESALYVWLGADQKKHFQPLPQFMNMMAETDFESRSFITMRNQRGYGTRRNWMAVRQELLYYTLGQPEFDVQVTDIPKILRGYYKEVGGEVVENQARSHSECIRASNVWVDVQQVFYRLEENVNGCYAQKPLKAIERIVRASSKPGDTVLDFFAHAGTTLLACEGLGRKCATLDIDPLFAEITIRRLERFRETGKTGWQFGHPFERELGGHLDLVPRVSSQV